MMAPAPAISDLGPAAAGPEIIRARRPHANLAFEEAAADS
jgi:hypothetical protein